VQVALPFLPRKGGSCREAHREGRRRVAGGKHAKRYVFPVGMCVERRAGPTLEGEVVSSALTVSERNLVPIHESR
jgi:hypothetical protein